MEDVKMQPSTRWLVVILVIVSALQVAACTRATGGTSVKVEPALVEPIEGSEFQRVVLTERAAERLDIQTSLVREELAEQAVEGDVIASTDTGTTAPGGVWVRVTLNGNGWNTVDRSQPARIRPLAGVDDGEDDDGMEMEGWTAEPDEGPADDDAEDDAEVGYYRVDGAEGSLAAGQRVLVELPRAGSGVRQLVVPYAALIYGLHGETWVYTNPEPLVFVRQPVTIDYIEGGEAVLLEGPPAGTAVATVGVAELYGIDTGVGK